MIVKSLEFAGCCANCPPDNNCPPRGGVEVAVERDEDLGEFLCLRCAERLANRLLLAVKECRRRRAEGHEYKDDRWATPAPGKRRRDQLRRTAARAAVAS